MNQEKRIVWLDTVKYVCIIMVMLSHLETRTEIWSIFYSPFFLSAFFFVSGYVYKSRHDFKGFLYKKIRQLLIPWLVFSVLDILLSHIISFNEHESLLLELKWNFLQIRAQGDGLWFVAALFIAFIPFYFFIKWYEEKSKDHSNKTYRKCITAILIAWALSIVSILYMRYMPKTIFPWKTAALPWHIEYMFQAMFYMVLGYIFRQEFEGWFDKRNTLKSRIVVWSIYVLIVFMPYLLEIKMPVMIGILYQYMCSLIGIAAVIMVAKVVKSNKYVNYVGQNTLICFAFHGKAYSAIQTVLKRFARGFYTAVLENVVASSVFCLIFALVLSFIMIIPAYIINRWFPFIMGRSKSI